MSDTRIFAIAFFGAFAFWILAAEIRKLRSIREDKKWRKSCLVVPTVNLNDSLMAFHYPPQKINLTVGNKTVLLTYFNARSLARWILWATDPLVSLPLDNMAVETERTNTIPALLTSPAPMVEVRENKEKETSKIPKIDTSRMRYLLRCLKEFQTDIAINDAIVAEIERIIERMIDARSKKMVDDAIAALGLRSPPT